MDPTALRRAKTAYRRSAYRLSRASLHDPLRHFHPERPALPGSLCDAQEIVSLEARPADQCAIDIVDREELAGISGLDRAAVEHPDALPGRPEARHQPLADTPMDLGNIVCGRREAGPDGPYRLVGDDEAGGACAVRQRAVELPIAYRKGASGLALRAGLANAHDRDEAGSPGCLRLGADRRVVFAMILPPLRVADDHRRRAGVGQHFGGQVARKGAGRLGPAILAADQKLRAASARRK